MNKVQTVLKMPVEVALKCGCNFETRKQWDSVLHDLRQFDMKPDLSYGRIAYTFASPFPASDRDFYVKQLVRRDFPEPGMIAVSAKSLPDCDEYPIQPKRVRGKIAISMILKPVIDSEGNECTDFWMTNWCDINGLVPKWLVNAAARSVPRQWCKTYESGCQGWMKKQKELADNRV